MTLFPTSPAPMATPESRRRTTVPTMGPLLPVEPVRAAPSICEAGDVAGPGEERCGYQPGQLRCVRRPHPEAPDAHVRVSAELDAVPPVQLLVTPAAARRTVDFCSAA